MEIYGWACSALFAICYMPQLYKTWRTKKVDDVSVGMWVVQLAAYTCGVIYSWQIQTIPLFVGYSYGWLCTFVWLTMWCMWRKGGHYGRESLT